MATKKAAGTTKLLYTLSTLETIEAIRRGMRYQLFSTIAHSSPFELYEWSQYLHLSDRTMQRYKKDRVPVDPIHAEKVFEIARLCDYGAQVFGDQANFDTWLDTTSIPLGDAKPKDLLDSSFGIELVREELIRIEHGMLA